MKSRCCCLRQVVFVAAIVLVETTHAAFLCNNKNFVFVPPSSSSSFGSSVGHSSCTTANRSERKKSLSSPSSLQSQLGQNEDLYAAVHRKEYEMKGVKDRHRSTADPVRMAMSYLQEKEGPMRLAKALRRVYDDPNNPANPDYVEPPDGKGKATDNPDEFRKQQMEKYGMKEMGMRRGSFIVDIKRKSHGRVFCNYDDASLVAEAMVQLGADGVFVNVDFASYGGDITELKSTVRAVRKISDRVPVVMKDIVVDEIQLGLAKEAGCDGVLLIASVLGPALDNFLNLATCIGLETIVECHTRNEVQRAINALAQNILVSNYDRITQTYHPKQALKLAGMFPGSGGPVISLACGGIETTDQMKKHLSTGYDGVVIGGAVMGSARAPEFIRAVRDRTLLPAELSQWGLEDVEFDMDGNAMSGPKPGVPDMDDPDAYL